MHNGMPLSDIASTLQAQVNSAKDYVTPLGRLSMMPSAKLDVQGVGEFEATAWTHGQIQQHTSIPSIYYNRMKDAEPALLATNVNTWFHSEPKTMRLLRTVDGKARAFVSDRFRSIDNYDVADKILPIAMKAGGIVRSAALTDTRLYLKIVLDERTFTVKSRMKGDLIRGGVVVRNSDVGNGAFAIENFVERLVCENGMIAESIIKKTHLGKRIEGDVDNAQEFFSNATRKLDNRAFWAKTQDVFAAMISVDKFKALAEKTDQAAKDAIEGELPAVVEAVVSYLGLPQEREGGILTALANDGDLSRWGLLNAVTAQANNEPDYETATELERAGGKLLNISHSDWQSLAAAA